MKVNILRLDNFGRGIAYYNNKICFIYNALPDEIVEFEIINETKKYIEGVTKNIIKSSINRVEEKCIYSNYCGGCVFQNYSYKEENKFKEDKIKNLVEKVLHIDRNIVKDIVYDKEFFYRNKLVLHGKNNCLGLYKNKSNDIVDIDKCIISNNKINSIIEKLKIIKGIEEVLIRTSNDEKSVIVDIKGSCNEYNSLIDLCDVLIVNNNLISKNSKIITNIGDKKYYLSSNSFFQVNMFLVEKMFNKVREYVNILRPNSILDLYCGTGSFGIYVSDSITNIVGVDYNKANIRDAIDNSSLNNLDNINFICDKVENVIDQFKDYDLVIVDPPRSGLDKKTIEYLIKMSCKNIIYISCDPNTLIRDLGYLNNDYVINEITPYNLFPRTYHVETVSVLCCKTVEK